MLKPLADRIIVKATTAEEVTRGGIVLPDSAKELQEYLRLAPNGANHDDATKTLEMLKPYIK